MDYPGLIAALPAATISAVATTPQGLTSAADVEVGSYATQSTSASRAMWIEPPQYIIHGPIMGGMLVSWVFEVSMVKTGGTTAQLEVWAEQMRAYFDGSKQPAGITDLISSAVRDTVLRTSQDGTDVELAMEIAFTGVQRPA